MVLTSKDDLQRQRSADDELLPVSVQQRLLMYPAVAAGRRATSGGGTDTVVSVETRAETLLGKAALQHIHRPHPRRQSEDEQKTEDRNTVPPKLARTAIQL